MERRQTATRDTAAQEHRSRMSFVVRAPAAEWENYVVPR